MSIFLPTMQLQFVEKFGRRILQQYFIEQPDDDMPRVSDPAGEWRDVPVADQLAMTPGDGSIEDCIANGVYVVVCERDTPEPDDEGAEPIAFETGMRFASLKAARRRSEQLGEKYGRTRIAKLVLIE